MTLHPDDKPVRLDSRLAPRLEARLLGDPDEPAPEPELEPALAVALLGDAVAARASDVHLEPAGEGAALRLRIDGRLREAALLPAESARRLTGQLRTLGRLDPRSAFYPEDARFSVRLDDRSIDLRMASVPCLGGEKLALRLFDPEGGPSTLESLGLSEDQAGALRRWLATRSGLFLSAGPTGAGKTTTAHALLRAREGDEHSVLTLEDPVEYRLEGTTQIEIDPEHALSFPEALRTALRLDPDYLLVGEIRDEESARTAVRAAVSGHAVLSTLHGATASAAVMPLLARGVARSELAASLAAVVAQRLARRLCPDCRRRAAPEPGEARWLEAVGAEVPSEIWRPKGCGACHGGYRGRVGLFEVWALEDEDREALTRVRDEPALQEHLRARGVPPLLEDALAKARDGLTGIDELRRVPDLLG